MIATLSVPSASEEPLAAAWPSVAVKRLANVTLGKMLQPNATESAVEAPYLRAAHVQPSGVLRLQDVKTMWFSPVELNDLTLERGDVVVVEGGVGGFGRAAFVAAGLNGWGFQNSINRLRPLANADGRYLAYCLQSLREAGYIRVAANVVSMPHLTAEKLGSLRVPNPPAPEQRAIADYLDRETARIDELIAKQERLIETLRERRAAVVADMVMGRRDGVSDKRSDVPYWMPPVPEHWAVLQLGFAVDTLAGFAFPSDGFSADGELVSLLRGVNVKPGVIDWSEAVYWDADAAPVSAVYSLSVGDLVLGMDRPLVSDGTRIAAVGNEDVPALLVQRVLRIRSADSCFRSYLRYLFSTQAFSTYIAPAFSGVSVPHMSEWQVRKFVIPRPPPNELASIVRELDAQTAKIDTLIAKTERFIELSRERRSALITAAVTGQIDVRVAA